MAVSNEPLVVAILRWIARIIGLALLAPVVLMAIYAAREGQLNPFNSSFHDGLIEGAFLTMALGILVGWKWEGTGGLLILGGFVFLAIVQHDFWPRVDTTSWLITGLLYLACWWRNRKRLASANTEQIECASNFRFLKFFRIPLVLVSAHAVLIGLLATSIALNSKLDPEAGMAWIFFVDVDYPISRCIGWLPQIFSSNALFPWTVLALGTIQWAIVGLIFQQVINLLGQPGKRFRND